MNLGMALFVLVEARKICEPHGYISHSKLGVAKVGKKS